MRRRREESLSRELAQLMQRRASIEHRLKSEHASMQGRHKGMRHQLVGRLDATMIRVHAQSSVRHQRNLHRAILELAGLEGHLNNARKAVQDACIERKAVELLREKRHQEWLDDMNARESRELDEMAMQRASLK